MDFTGLAIFWCGWWLICLIILGFVLTVLIGCIMIVGLLKFIAEQLKVIRIMR